MKKLLLRAALLCLPMIGMSLYSCTGDTEPYEAPEETITQAEIDEINRMAFDMYGVTFDEFNLTRAAGAEVYFNISELKDLSPWAGYHYFTIETNALSWSFSSDITTRVTGSLAKVVKKNDNGSKAVVQVYVPENNTFNKITYTEKIIYLDSNMQLRSLNITITQRTHVYSYYGLKINLGGSVVSRGDRSTYFIPQVVSSPEGYYCYTELPSSWLVPTWMSFNLHPNYPTTPIFTLNIRPVTVPLYSFIRVDDVIRFRCVDRDYSFTETIPIYRTSTLF